MPVERKGEASRFDEDAGRTDPRRVLRRQLASAPPAYLSGALSNPELAAGELILLLRNRQAPGALLREVASDRGRLRHYEVKRALVLHPRTPPAVARNLVRHLYWKELVEITLSPHVHRLVRRQGERCLSERLEGLALGERVNLARCVGRGVIGTLTGSSEEPVLRALLENPRLVEADVVRLAAGKAAPAATLASLQEHPRWGRRREVLLALAGNRRTPVAVAMRAVQALRPSDLSDLSRDPRAPRIVRIGAERRLAALRSRSQRTAWEQERA